MTVRLVNPTQNYAGYGLPYSGNPLMLDAVAFVAAAYSTRWLNKDYDGPLINLRRASDGAQRDFSPGRGGFLDQTEMAAWLNGAVGNVQTFYDQSLAGNHCTTAGTGPVLTMNGIGRKPSLFFSTAINPLRASFSLSGTALSFVQVSRDTARSGDCFYFGMGQGSTAGASFGLRGSTGQDWVAQDYVFTANGTDAGQAPRSVTQDGATAVPTGPERWTGILSSDRHLIRRNGAAMTERSGSSQAAGAAFVAANQFVMGARTQTLSGQHTGTHIGEMVLFRSDINAQIAAYEASQLLWLA